MGMPSTENLSPLTEQEVDIFGKWPPRHTDIMPFRERNLHSIQQPLF